MRISTLFTLLSALLLAACSSPAPSSWQPAAPVTGGAGVTPVQMLQQEVNLVPRLIPKGTYGRRYHRSMNPRYITIHATENYSGDAFAHASALRNGKLRAHKRPGGNRIGFLTWHFTVQDNVALQHLPTNEQGEHADFDGPGNNYSIGIEMCEHRGNNIGATIDRTARLAAYLMYQHNIPLRNVVPHYHWPRRGASPPHKNCPHFLLENGRPGKKWAGFLSRVQAHYNRLIPGPCPRI